MGRSESNKVNTLFFDFFFENADIYYKTFSVPFQLSFQDSATPVMNGLLDLHDYIFFFLIVIISVVIVLLVKVRFTFVLNNNEGFDLNIFTDYTFATPYNRLVGLSFLSFFFKMLPKIISNLVLWILQLLKNFLFFFFFLILSIVLFS